MTEDKKIRCRREAVVVRMHVLIVDDPEEPGLEVVIGDACGEMEYTKVRPPKGSEEEILNLIREHGRWWDNAAPEGWRLPAEVRN